MVTYVNDLRLNEIATGDSSGTWGTTTNTNLELIGEAMGYGTEAVANASTHTITMADGTTDGFRCTFLRLTGGGQICTVTLAPNTLSHTWIIRNTTGYALTFTQGSGANVIIAAGLAKMVTTDGLGSGAVVYECLYDLELGGKLNISGDATIGDDLTLLSDAAVVNFGVNSDVTLTHVHDSGLSLSAGANITELEVISTEASNAGGPYLTLNRDSASPANNDALGTVAFYGDNNASESTAYARIVAQIADITDGSEDGRLYLQTMNAGTLSNSVQVTYPEGITIYGGDLTFGTAAKGVHLGVTTPTAANLLDDYEEGTWTCTVKGTSSDPSTALTHPGRYTKIGNVVTVAVYTSGRNTTGISGALEFHGLPFTATGETAYQTGTWMGSSITSSGALCGDTLVQYSNTYLRPFYGRDSSTWTSNVAYVSTAAAFSINVTYIAA